MNIVGKESHLISLLRSRHAIFVLLASLSCLFSATGIMAAEQDTQEEQNAQPEEVIPLEPEHLRRDRALAEQVEDAEVKWLLEGDKQFLGIFKQDISDNTLGSVLMLPPPGDSPLTPALLPQLALTLSTAGWNSLAISLPEMDFSAPKPAFPEAASVPVKEPADSGTEESSETPVSQPATALIAIPEPEKWYSEQQTLNMEKLLERMMAAEAELLASGKQYILMAQGISSELVLELISNGAIKPAGLIILDIQHPNRQRWLSIPKNLAAIDIPVLDIYKLTDTDAATKRKLLNKSPDYRQLPLPLKGDNFLGSEKLLIKQIRGWLKRHYQ